MARRRRAVVAEPNIVRYMAWLRDNGIAKVDSYHELWSWSVRDIEAFWESIWSYFDVRSAALPETILRSRVMPGAEWFPGTRLNYAEHIFRMANDQRPCLVAIDEAGVVDAWTWSRLRRETAAFAAYLRRIGVQRGDRVVGYLPNVPEAVVAFLASSSVGAIWSVCNQDVAVQGVLSRFRQLGPTVLVVADGCCYGGRQHDRRQAIEEIRRELPTLKATVVVPRLGQGASGSRDETGWQEATAVDAPLEFERVPFAHPLWLLFSSGTTGAPKGIVHGHGGILLEQLKFSALHLDLGPDDVFFWYCSTSWVMWNVVVSALLTGATIVLYDGSPNQPDAGRLWRIVQERSVTVLGVSPAYLQLCAKEDMQPRTAYQLRSLRAIGCTGAPIPIAAYRWVQSAVGEHVPLNSVSGGTDVAGGFVGGCPLLPVYPGENSARCLGVAAEAWNEAGQPVVDEVGELVVTKAMPSMPLFFWADPDGKRYRDAYFDTYPGVWRHGDWVTVTRRGSVIVHGRSDATLNRQGVRLGSAEIYQAVEALPEIQEALVVGIEEPEGGYWMPLFVHLRPGTQLDEGLRARINQVIRAAASARHVPDEIIEIPGVPHTLTGKRLEVPIKRILLGTPPAQALNRDAVDHPELIETFVKLGAARARSQKTAVSTTRTAAP